MRIDEDPIETVTPETVNPKGFSRRLRDRSGWLTLGALAVIGAIAVVALWQPLRSDPEPMAEPDVAETVSEILAEATPGPAISALVYAAVLPSFVIVQSSGVGVEKEHGLGSGVVINANGDVLTALHIVQGAEAIQVSYADGSTSPAFLMNAEPDTDIALLTPAFPPRAVLPGTIGNAAALRVGDEVFAIGNPLGLVGSLSAGVVSGLEREFQPSGRLEPIEGLIQFDAAVNLGNSGGPLVDRRGQVVGIVTGLMNPSNEDVFAGIGFAVPIEQAASAAGNVAR